MFSKKIFDYVEPVSRALQAHNIDILTAIDFLKKSEKNISNLRCDSIFQNLYDTVKTTAQDLNFEIELNLPTKRQRRVPRQSDETNSDDPINNPVVSYKVNTYFIVIDKVLTELKKRFQDNTIDIAKDLALLSPKLIYAMRKELSIPTDAFSSICENYKQFLNKDDILREYIQFIKSNAEITVSEKLPDFLHTINSSFEEESSCDESNQDNETDNDLTTKTIQYSGSLLIMYKFFLLKGLKSVFPNLYQVIQIGVTLPISSASTERSFSKLKIVKTRLRSTMTQNRLEDLLIISCESDISVQTENVVNNFAKRSSVLSKALSL
ncbi:uncharacterized protein LOC114128308 [Aphis gossypii]|uniref:uncharacterized protein LOC114128308 n=1 Tax=Aphis gossypii TaxID=80765 RepID=UPI002158D3A2|nr:uncharacterized protein LOC114128308 [Aphis gossypii]